MSTLRERLVRREEDYSSTDSKENKLNRNRRLIERKGEATDHIQLLADALEAACLVLDVAHRKMFVGRNNEGVSSWNLKALEQLTVATDHPVMTVTDFAQSITPEVIAHARAEKVFPSSETDPEVVEAAALYEQKLMLLKGIKRSEWLATIVDYLVFRLVRSNNPAVVQGTIATLSHDIERMEAGSGDYGPLLERAIVLSLFPHFREVIKVQRSRLNAILSSDIFGDEFVTKSPTDPATLHAAAVVEADVYDDDDRESLEATAFTTTMLGAEVQRLRHMSDWIVSLFGAIGAVQTLGTIENDLMSRSPMVNDAVNRHVEDIEGLKRKKLAAKQPFDQKLLTPENQLKARAELLVANLAEFFEEADTRFSIARGSGGEYLVDPQDIFDLLRTPAKQEELANFLREEYDVMIPANGIDISTANNLYEKGIVMKLNETWKKLDTFGKLLVMVVTASGRQGLMTGQIDWEVMLGAQITNQDVLLKRVIYGIKKVMRDETQPTAAAA